MSAPRASAARTHAIASRKETAVARTPSPPSAIDVRDAPGVNVASILGADLLLGPLALFHAHVAELDELVDVLLGDEVGSAVAFST